MTEKEKNLLAVFDERLHEMIDLCTMRKRRTEELESLLAEKEETLQQTRKELEVMNSKYSNLLTAKAFADNDGLESARKRVSKLVREIDTCIAMLNV